MFVLVEDRSDVGAAFVAGFEREGVSVLLLDHDNFEGWFEGISGTDLAAVEAIVVGDPVDRREAVGRRLAARQGTPLIALLDRKTLAETLTLLNASYDDVVGKPVHAREILARVNSIRRRARSDEQESADLAVFVDGRDPLVGGEIMALPRRERRILECLAESRSAWMTKSQIFARVYGILNESLDESVVESHICRLRRRLKLRLGYDPIESQRFLGYRLMLRGRQQRGTAYDASSRQFPKERVLMEHDCAGGR